MPLPANILVEADFIGYYGLYKGTDGKIQAYINQYVPKYLYEIFGAKLSALVVQNRNIEETPENRYYRLINGIKTDDDCGTFYTGLKPLLLGLVWFHYVADDKYRQTAGGTKVQDAEVSKGASFDTSFIYEKYNISIDNWKALHRYLCDNKDVYPEFKGKEKKYISWL